MITHVCSADDRAGATTANQRIGPRVDCTMCKSIGFELCLGFDSTNQHGIAAVAKPGS